MELTRAEAEARVARGVALLDVRRPGWAEQINTDTLDMSQGCFCVLGQLEGAFNDAVVQLYPERPRNVGEVLALSMNRYEQAERCGFYVHSPEMNAYRVLKDAWLAAISARVPVAVWTHRQSILSQYKVG